MKWTELASGPEPLPVLGRTDERFHHVGVQKVALESVQFVEPESKARLVRIATKVAEVFHQHKRPVELSVRKLLRLGNLTEHRGPGFSGGRQTANEGVAEDLRVRREVTPDLATAELSGVEI